MMRFGLVLALGLAGCGSEGAPAPAATQMPTPTPTVASAIVAANAAQPDLATCPAFKIDADSAMERQRDKPLVFPATVAKIVATDFDRVAVSTLGGKTLCIDARYQEAIADAALTADKRFFGYGWSGYEAYGYILADRARDGAEFETGAKPVFSASGKRLASVEWSESGFGGLNGVLVMAVEPDRLRELGRIENLPEGYTDWRFDRWVRNGCFTLSAVTFENYPEDGEPTDRTPRDRFIGLETNKLWAIEARDTCPT
jgi:hypothetical protein